MSFKIKTPPSNNDNTVYAGVDVALFAIYGKTFEPLGNATTISYSIHREKFPVRRIGHAHAVGYTRGTRTIAGSIVFVNFRKAALTNLFNLFYREEYRDVSNSILTDQLPPFDILMVFRNEAGHLSQMRLIGVEIADEGGVFGVDEAYTETTMQYISRDISLLTEVHTNFSESGNLVLANGTSSITDFIGQFQQFGSEGFVASWDSNDDAGDNLVIR